MTKQGWILAFSLLAAGCGSTTNSTQPAPVGSKPPTPGPLCTALATSETSCSGGVDDDCDGFVDCLDSECEGQACGDGLTCSGGACRKACAAGDATCVPELPTIPNVRVTQRGDTAIIEFEPSAGAKDYRIYPEPAAGDWLIGSNGEVGVKNGVYRCAGDRVFQDRQADDANGFDCSIVGCDNARHNYSRSEAEATLGYVFLTPGPDRVPVYRVADPAGGLPQRRLGRATVLRGQQRRIRDGHRSPRRAARQKAGAMTASPSTPRKMRQKPCIASTTRQALTGKALTSCSFSRTAPSTTRGLPSLRPRSPIWAHAFRSWTRKKPTAWRCTA